MPLKCNRELYITMGDVSGFGGKDLNLFSVLLAAD
jgi:hypothetical protein